MEELYLEKQLEALKLRHSELDATLNDIPLYDQFTRARIGKEKLALKDEIMRLEDKLYPDIIA